MITLTPQDIKTIGQLAEHHDSEKLGIATNEALVFDLGNLLGTFIDEVESNWNSTETKWVELISGSTFTCGNKTVKHYGLKEVLKYYTYARYVLINGFNDTPNGSVTKSNPFSIPKSMRDLDAFSIKYRNMGKQLFDVTVEYLCANQEFFTDLDSGVCANCGCTKLSNPKPNTSGVGFTSNIITKWDV